MLPVVKVNFKTVKSARRYLPRMKPGDSVCYYVGFLARDRMYGSDLSFLANFMLRQGTPDEFSFGEGCTVKGEGLGHLTQRRLTVNRFAYFFTRGGVCNKT